jgi:hypothetical protein
VVKKLVFDDDATVLPGDLVKAKTRNEARTFVTVTDKGLASFGDLAFTKDSEIRVGDPLFVVARIDPDPRIRAERPGLRVAAYVMSPRTIGWIALGDPSFNAIEFLEGPGDEQIDAFVYGVKHGPKVP